jgi:signal transduction histidine kinase
MTIRTRLTYTFTILVVAILLFAFSAIYYFSVNYRAKEFSLHLKNKGITTAKLLIETKGVYPDLLRAIDSNTVNALYQEQVVLYDYLNKKIYCNTDKVQPPEPSVALLNKIRLEKEVKYQDGEREVVGFVFTDKFDRFVVFASAIDENGLRGLHNLRIVLISAFIITIIIIWFAGFLFSGQALKPISNVVKEVDNITVNNLNLRVSEGNGSDEIAQLAIKFNKMLERLEASFEMQRNFVSNASHELRTPITAIGGQIEIALMKKHEVEDHERILKSIWEDIKNMNKLSHGLLDLAQASLDVSRIKLKSVRIDELLWQTVDDLVKLQKNYSINIDYKDLPEDERRLTIKGNESLLKTAISNILDNGCKYSADHRVEIKVDFKDKSILMKFIDNGIGIEEKELKSIFEPFYRAANAKTYAGHGIGLSLVSRIISLHKGSVHMTSELNKGTTVYVSFPLLEHFY